MKKILLLVLIPFFSNAQNDDSSFIKKMSDEILVNGKAYDWLHHLTKKIGHRLSGSTAYNKASAWGEITMKEAGADKVVMQQTMVPHWVRGKGDFAKIISVNNKKENVSLNVLALGNSNAGTATARVVVIKNFDELEKRKDEIKGKIVFFNYPFNQTFVETFRAYGDAGKYRHGGASRAAKYGAVGCLIRSLTGSTDNFPHTGAMRYNDSFPKIPALALGLKDANVLADLAIKNNVTLSISTHGKMLADTIAHNVIGEIIGTEFPNQFITIGGHLDSWDVGEGAHDDGAGCVQTMEVLRVLKVLNYKPKHSIRFVLFANEENGLKGGNAYANAAVENKEEHIFALESDAGGFTPRGFTFKASNEQLQKIQSWTKLFLPYGGDKLEMGGGGADIGPLNEKLKTPLAELRPDSQRYFDYHHTDNDVFENVNKRELLLGAVNMAALVYLIDKYGL
jgi:carboxypeptidase Q